MNLKEMIKRQQEILDKAKEEKRQLSAEETAEFDELQRQIEAKQGEESKNVDIEAERRRAGEILSLCREFDISADEYIKNGNTIEEVRAALLDSLKKEKTPLSARVTIDEGDKFREAASDALLMRAGAAVQKPAEGASELMGMDLKNLAIECLSREGESMGSLLRMSSDELYGNLVRQFYNPTAAFPSILDTTIRKSIVKAYEAVPTTYQEWTTKGSLRDFKESADHSYLVGGAGEFKKIPEGGEITHDAPKDYLMPRRKLDTYGKQFTMTRQAFINDDIGFISEMPALYATKAKQTINKQVYEILYNNGEIFDGKALFAADHKNLMESGTKPSAEAIQNMIKKMQLQTDPFGENIIVRPAYIIVPVGYGFDLYTILASATINTAGNTQAANPLYNYPIKVIEEPTLNGLAGEGACPWFMAADKTTAKSIQVDYLNGNEVPILKRYEKPGQLGFIWDIFLDWGITPVDFRGLVKNPGIKL